MKYLFFYFLLFCVFVSSFASRVVAQTTPAPRYDAAQNCAQNPAGAYTSLEDCFRAIDSSPPADLNAPTAPTTESGTPFCEVGFGVWLDSCEINEKTEKVIVRFHGFRSDPGVVDNYGKYFCYKSDQSKCEKDNFKAIKNSDGGIIEEEVCGDGKEALKGTSHKGGCDGDDYFHQGKIYRLGLYYEKDKNTKIAEAAFYIGHFKVDVDITPLDPRERAQITVKLSGIRESQNKSGENQNNYKLLLQGRDNTYESSECIRVDKNSKTGEFTFGRSGDTEHPSLKKGRYQLKVQEEVKDGGSCDGGFTYWTVPITVGDAERPGKIGNKIWDPSNVESRQIARADHVIHLPCDEKNRTSDNRCLAVTTGIGEISVQPESFVASLYGWLLSLAGVAGLILLLRAGYKILTSGGNKEKVGEARDEIRSVILGILFLVVALVILETISTDLLKIPGFTR